MRFQELPIVGAYLVGLEPRRDERGYFARCWCAEEFQNQGLNPQMAQTNVIVSPQRGTLRGVHFQRRPHQEAKLVRCLRGEIFDVAVDLRADSPTYLTWHAVRLRAGDQRMFYIPEGCAHGFQTLTDDTEVQYQASCPYNPSHAAGLRFDDAVIGVDWPLPVTLLSEADASWPAYVPHSTAQTAARGDARR